LDVKIHLTTIKKKGLYYTRCLISELNILAVDFMLCHSLLRRLWNQNQTNKTEKWSIFKTYHMEWQKLISETRKLHQWR